MHAKRSSMRSEMTGDCSKERKLPKHAELKRKKSSKVTNKQKEPPHISHVAIFEEAINIFCTFRDISHGQTSYCLQEFQQPSEKEFR